MITSPSIQIRPFTIEHVGEPRVEGVAVEQLLLHGLAVLTCVLVDVLHALQRRDDVWLERLAILD